MEEGVGESSSPPTGLAGGGHDIRSDIYARLVEDGNDEAVSNPDFWEQLDAHFSRLPPSYGLDASIDRAEDVLLHQKILAEAKDPGKRPAFHVRFMKHIRTRANGKDDIQEFVGVVSTSRGCDGTAREGEMPSIFRIRDCGIDFEPCSKLEDLNLDLRKNTKAIEDGRHLAEALSSSQEVTYFPIHEIIFSTVDKPKLLCQLSAMLSDIGLNIREAHVFSTTDGYSLDAFVVDGWPDESTDGLHKEIEEAIARNEGSWSTSSHSSAGEKILALQPKVGDWEIDQKMLKMGGKIACGSCGDLYRGSYLRQDVAIKVLRSEHLNETQGIEFIQEVMILREVQHRNVVRFVGACTKPPQFCIVTEYMPGGNLYNFLHKHHNILDLSMLLKFSLDVCKGMDYLHQNSIIHRDLKTANLLMDNNHHLSRILDADRVVTFISDRNKGILEAVAKIFPSSYHGFCLQHLIKNLKIIFQCTNFENVVKVADFGVARFQSQRGVMTAETGTYRWMAPEVINHQPYDQKADVFSFAIVLWELATSRIPYDTMTPLQAALGVRQGLRPELPENTHPRLLDLMQRCWEAIPSDRPSFKEITVELEELFEQIQGNKSSSRKR